MKYKIVFKNNTGAFSIDALAVSTGGDWRDTVSNYDGRGLDIGFIECPDENSEYLEQLLLSSENVVEYSVV